VLKNFAEKTGVCLSRRRAVPRCRSAFEKIVGELGTQYTIAYEPKNTTKDGKWRSIELRVAKAESDYSDEEGISRH
jgi:hypothetical protein